MKIRLNEIASIDFVCTPDHTVRIPLRAIPKPRMTARTARYGKAAARYWRFKDLVKRFCLPAGLRLPLKGAWFWIAECYFPDRRIGDKDNIEKALNDILFANDKRAEGYAHRIFDRGALPHIVLRLWSLEKCKESRKR